MFVCASGGKFTCLQDFFGEISSSLALEPAMQFLLLILFLHRSLAASLSPIEEDSGSGAGSDQTYSMPEDFTIDDAEEQIHFRKEGKSISKEYREYKLDLSLVLYGSEDYFKIRHAN